MRKQIQYIIILLGMIFFLTTKVHSQNLNFQETVNYINEKLKDYGEYSNEIIAKNDGRLYEKRKSSGRVELLCNLLNLTFCEAKLDNNKELIYFSKYSSGKSITFQLGGRNWGFLSLIDETDDLTGERLANAFKHLRNLCTPAKDPFDN